MFAGEEEEFLFDLVDDYDKEYGVHFEFEGRINKLQADVVKRALENCDYKSTSYAVKEKVIEELVTAAEEIYLTWKFEDPKFDLNKKEHNREFYTTLTDELWMLAKKYKLHMEQ